jgi:hypothetical protein
MLLPTPGKCGSRHRIVFLITPIGWPVRVAVVTTQTNWPFAEWSFCHLWLNADFQALSRTELEGGILEQ